MPINYNLYTRLQPIIAVSDLTAEARFYNALGFAVQSESETFASIRYGDHILFGLEAEPGLTNGAAPFTWQIGVQSVRAIHEIAMHAQLPVVEKPLLQPWGEWTIKLKSPAGFTVTFEGRE
jgi:catechol 2,3-dioxygenase-like lactoylglutathione lyase family enzyme